MRFLFRQVFRHGIGRRSLCALLLGVYVITAAGIPLPLARAPEKTGEAFPCARNRCGCDSAERCWRSCCCHTLAERIAWAMRNGVRPPDFAIAQARARGIDLTLLAKSCGAGAQPGKCCAVQGVAKEPGCCTERQFTSSATVSNRPADSDQIIGWRALACRGQALNWLAAVPTLIVPPHKMLNDLPLAERLAPAKSEAAHGVPDAPDVPPPKWPEPRLAPTSRSVAA